MIKQSALARRDGVRFRRMSLLLLDRYNPMLNLITDILHQGSRPMLR